jgi:hypothetical protein
MPRTFDQLLADFAALKPGDFDDEAAGLNRLQGLTDEFLAQSQPELAIPALFAVMERMPVTELGAPGPLVYTLESMRGHHEHELVESSKRQPANLNVWMVNRILKGTCDPEQEQLEQLSALLEYARTTRSEPAARLMPCSRPAEVSRN